MWRDVGIVETFVTNYCKQPLMFSWSQSEASSTFFSGSLILILNNMLLSII
jgi:hypothetical protein